MGQKAIPIGLRIGINTIWNSSWFASGKDYVNFFIEDIKIKKFVESRFRNVGVSSVLIDRPKGRPIVTICSSKPGLVIGKKGSGLEALKEDLSSICDLESLNISEVRRPDLCAQILSDSVAHQMEKRVSYKKASKRIMQQAMKAGANGIKIVCSGRLGGAEIARRECFRQGRVPSHTLRACVDYGSSIAKTSYGVCGVKVFIYTGDSVVVKNVGHGSL